MPLSLLQGLQSQQVSHLFYLGNLGYWLQTPISAGKNHKLGHNILVVFLLLSRRLEVINHPLLLDVCKSHSQAVSIFAFSFAKGVSWLGSIYPYKKGCNTMEAEPILAFVDK